MQWTSICGVLTYKWAIYITLLPLHAQRTKRLSEPEVREARAKQCLLNLTGYCSHQLMVAGVPAQTRASQHSFMERGGDIGSSERTRWVIKTKRHKYDREWVVAVIQQELYIVERRVNMTKLHRIHMWISQKINKNTRYFFKALGLTTSISPPRKNCYFFELSAAFLIGILGDSVPDPWVTPQMNSR